jgi:hypothetical protein
MTCACTSHRGGTVEIARHVLSTEDKDRREILLHLRDWQIVNPGATRDGWKRERRR